MKQEQRPIPWSQWPNVLGLDAPLVILGWTLLFSAHYNTQVDPGACASIFLGIWSGYILDRWLDAQRIPENSLITVRHRFARRYSGALIQAGLGLAAASAAFGLVSFPFEIFWMAVALLTIAILYFRYIASTPKAQTLRQKAPIKEFSVSLILAGAAIVPLGWRPLLLAPFSTALCGALLATVYFQNCALIASWDQSTDQRQNQSGYFTLQPHGSKIVRWIGPVILITLAGIHWGLPEKYQVPSRILFAFAISATGLQTLHFFRNQIPLDSRRALADVALMSAWIF